MRRHYPTVLSLLCLLALPAQASTAATTQARAIVTQAPDYPASARALGIEGLVVLHVQIDENGQAADVRLATPAAHPSLQDAALDSIKGWQFKPALKNGEPVTSTLRIPLRFELLAEGKQDRRALGPATLKSLW